MHETLELGMLVATRRTTDTGKVHAGVETPTEALAQHLQFIRWQP